MQIPLEKIVSLGNVRNTQNIEELAVSLKENGQKVPIQVFPQEDKYVIKYGHRRVAAAKQLGWTSIEAIIEDPNLDTLVADQAIENLHRDGMSYLEMGLVYQRLRDKYNWTQTQIAEKFGVSDAQVSLALAMLKATKTLQDAVNSGKMSPSAVEPLLSLEPEAQERLAAPAIRAKTVRAVKALVNTYKTRTSISNMSARRIEDEMDPEEIMTVASIEEAVRHLKKVEESRIQHPELQSKVRMTVRELIKVADKILNELERKK